MPASVCRRCSSIADSLPASHGAYAAPGADQRLHGQRDPGAATAPEARASAAEQFLDDLARLVWDHYELPLFELLRPDLEEEVHAQPDLFDPDDALPF